MFFVLSKTVALLLLPSNFLLGLGLAGVGLMMTRCKRERRVHGGSKPGASGCGKFAAGWGLVESPA